MSFLKITENIFAVSGSNLSKPEDSMSYLVRTKENKLVLIDCGLNSFELITRNIESTGVQLKNLIALILTHAHIDHTGSAHQFRKNYPDLKIYCHSWEKDIIEGISGAEKMTAAHWYGINYHPVKIDREIKKDIEFSIIGGTKFKFIHTPGHTPGSMSIIVEDSKKKVLFGQDIHGPFMKEFQSNIKDWARSMKILLLEEPDILAEGHFGIYKSKEAVRKFIQSHLRQNNML